MNSIKCVMCDSEIIYRHDEAVEVFLKRKYCSIGCQKKYKKLKLNKFKELTKSCIICEKEMTYNSESEQLENFKRRKTCSTECEQKSRSETISKKNANFFDISFSIHTNGVVNKEKFHKYNSLIIQKYLSEFHAKSITIDWITSDCCEVFSEKRKNVKRYVNIGGKTA